MYDLKLRECQGIIFLTGEKVTEHGTCVADYVVSILSDLAFFMTLL